MSAKISAAKRAAFLKAVAETGNQTIAAERAKVSRSWVVLHRARDAAFDAVVRGAVLRFAASAAPDQVRGAAQDERSLDFARDERSSNKPAKRWAWHEGEEMVVRGTGGAGGGKRVQIARARVKQWTQATERRFLAALGETCNVKLACAAVGLTAASAYNHAGRWPHFRRRWDAAVADGLAKLEAEQNARVRGLLEEAEGESPLLDAETAHWRMNMHKRRLARRGEQPLPAWHVPDRKEREATLLATLDRLAAARVRGEAEDE